GQISAGDLDGAKKTANIVGAAVMRNIEEAAGRGAISLGNVADRVRDGAAGRDALGKGLEKQLDSINKLASSDTRLKKALDKDGDGKVELWELRDKLKDAGITQLAQMNKNGDKQVSAEEIRAALIPTSSPKVPDTRSLRSQGVS
ncbi:MAG: hypothetical protein ACK5ZH_00785, partial [Alphaproteobacteria bacterium]